jgi:hypothetical protein
MMRSKLIAAGLALAVLGAEALFGQSSPGSSPGVEFPVIMRQKVAAGGTPVGTKVEARLTLATLVDHAVIPQDAVLSGEVTESVAKSAKGPSRLGIRMDSAQWKNGSARIKVYLTAWFYPIAQLVPEDHSEEDLQANSTPMTAGMGHKNAPTRSYPTRDQDTNLSPSPAQPLPAPSTENHRDVMKGVEAKRQSDGAITLSSQRSNIKLDKTTTYVMAAGDLVPPK